VRSRAQSGIRALGLGAVTKDSETNAEKTESEMLGQVERMEQKTKTRKQPAYLTSKSDDWRTPVGFFQQLHKEFGFEIDLCASLENAQLPVFYTKEQDALNQVWRGTCWMNPPYGRNVTGKWVRKAYISAKRNKATVVCLIPARTDTKWWHKYCAKAEVRFVQGRLRFNEHKGKGAATFPSAVVVFSPGMKAITVYLRKGNTIMVILILMQ
jgi:phage N-6-adenine-methyltransferase